MADVDPHPNVPPDPLSLTSSTVPELVETLLATAVRGPESVGQHAAQLAHLIAARTVRLVRLGTRIELDDAAVAAADAVVSPEGRHLRESDPDAFRRLSAASVILGIAAEPSGNGAELTVLRSWSGRARDSVRQLARSEPHGAQPSSLATALGLDITTLTALLTDLEAAGLVERVIDANGETLVLGPTARTPHVQEIVGLSGSFTAPSSAPREPMREKAVEDHFEALFTGSAPSWVRASHPTHRGFADELRRLREHAYHCDAPAVESLMISDSLSMARVFVKATLRRGPIDFERFEENLVWLVRFEGERIVDLERYAPKDSWLPPFLEAPRWGQKGGEVVPGRGSSGLRPTMRLLVDHQSDTLQAKNELAYELGDGRPTIYSNTVDLHAQERSRPPLEKLRHDTVSEVKLLGFDAVRRASSADR